MGGPLSSTRTAPDLARRRREELREFLRSRRARLTPGDVGLPDTGRRRTPGLRREEIALLAGVGQSWYTWLEQGRDITVSPNVIEAVSTALRLSETERDHFYVLAGLNPPLPRNSETAPPVSPALSRLIDQWLPYPAYILDLQWNLVARNAATDPVFGFEHETNCVVAFFTNPRYRARHQAWNEAARSLVAELRHRRARFPHHSGFDKLIDTLLGTSEDFADLWSRHHVDARPHRAKELRHPELGHVVLEHTLLTRAEHPDLTVVLYSPRSGSDASDIGEALGRLLG